MRGRKPKPSKIKALQGGKKTSHRPTNVMEPDIVSIPPDCPAYLDDDAKNEWARMTKELEAVGILTKIDKAVFATYCVYFSMWKNATEQIQKNGMVYKAPNGMPMFSPYYTVANKANQLMMKALIELGMTPSSRSRLKVEKPKETKSAMDDFLNGK